MSLRRARRGDGPLLAAGEGFVEALRHRAARPVLVEDLLGHGSPSCRGRYGSISTPSDEKPAPCEKNAQFARSVAWTLSSAGRDASSAGTPSRCRRTRRSRRPGAAAGRSGRRSSSPVSGRSARWATSQASRSAYLSGKKRSPGRPGEQDRELGIAQLLGGLQRVALVHPDRHLFHVALDVRVVEPGSIQEAISSGGNGSLGEGLEGGAGDGADPEGGRDHRHHARAAWRAAASA